MVLQSLNVTGFQVQRAAVVNGVTGAYANIGPPLAANVTTYLDASAALNASYSYQVIALNGSNGWYQSPPSNIVTVTVAVPAAPSNLAATASALSTTPPTVSLTWIDNSNNETGFTIQRAANVTFTVGLTTATVGPNITSYRDTTVSATPTTYFYRVRASNVVGNSAWSNTVTVTDPGQLPMAPTNLTFASSTRNSATLAWTDNAANEQGFHLQRSTAGAAGPWVLVATVPANTAANPATTGPVTYTNTGLARNTTYWYQIQAYNASGASAFSNVVSGKTLP